METLPSVRPAIDVAEDERVLTRAVLDVGSRLGLTTAELGRIVGLSQRTLSKIRSAFDAGRDAPRLRVGSKPFELGLQLVRIDRSLNALVGGSEDEARAWWRNRVTGLQNRCPQDQARTVTGLINIANYLDASRARG